MAGVKKGPGVWQGVEGAKKGPGVWQAPKSRYGDRAPVARFSFTARECNSVSISDNPAYWWAVPYIGEGSRINCAICP